MNPWWNLPFALLVVLGMWCRLRGPRRLVGAVAGLLHFFGADAGGTDGARRAAADLLAAAGVSGLLFVAWSGRLAVTDDAWLVADVLASSLGIGLVTAWILARLDPERGGGASARISVEMEMFEVEELPHPAAIPGREPPSSDTR